MASPGIKRGAVLNVVRHAVEVYADPDSIPERFNADLTGLDFNDNVRWHDLKGTEGTRPVIAYAVACAGWQCTQALASGTAL